MHDIGFLDPKEWEKKDCFAKTGTKFWNVRFRYFLFPAALGESKGRLSPFLYFFFFQALHLALQLYDAAKQVIPIKKHLLQMETSKIKDAHSVSVPMILFFLMFFFSSARKILTNSELSSTYGIR